MRPECYLTAAAETEEMSQPPDLVWDPPALVLEVLVEDPELTGVQHPAEIAGKPTTVGWKPQQFVLPNFLLQLRLVELHPGEVLDDLLDVVAELVARDSHHEEPIRVLRKVFVLVLGVRWEVGGADGTLAVTRYNARSHNRLKLRFSLNGVVGWEDGLGPPASFLVRN